MTQPTVDDFLRDPYRVRDKLADMCEQHGFALGIFPRPIAQRIHRRDGWALWRYRGTHRPAMTHANFVELLNTIGQHYADWRARRRRRNQHVVPGRGAHRNG